MDDRRKLLIEIQRSEKGVARREVQWNRTTTVHNVRKKIKEIAVKNYKRIVEYWQEYDHQSRANHYRNP